MPSPLDKNRQQNPEAENDKSFTGNEEKQVDEKQVGLESQSEESPGKDDETHRDAYRSRNLEIEKERD
jgi:hypothetical protein